MSHLTRPPRRESPFAEIRRYVGFDAHDEACLARARPLVEPHFATIADAFYARVRAHPDAAAVFRDEQQIERQKHSLVRWMERVFRGPYDDAYYAETLKIGQVHVAVGLPQRYMLTGMNVVRSALARVLMTSDIEDKPTVVEAVHRALDLELAGMLDSYFSTLVSRAQQSERTQVMRRAERLASVGILAAGLAHEIRNPLNGAQLHLTFLERGLGGGGELQRSELLDATSVVKHEIQRLSNLVTEFLDFARPQPMVVRPIDLREVCERARGIAVADAKEAEVTLRFDSATEPVTAEVDADKLAQVLLNLLRNAIEATASGGLVVLKLKKADDAAIIQVEDDGVGIADPNAPIFDPFFTTKDAGSGLGLSIAHRIISDHDGTLTFSSKPGRTVFTIRLALHPGSSPREASQNGASQ